MEKSVGGLVCSVTQVVYPGAQPQFACGFKEGAVDYKEDYDAINVQAVDPREPGIMGASYQQKIAGDLMCSVTQGVYPGAQPAYECSWIYKTGALENMDAPSVSDKKSKRIEPMSIPPKKKNISTSTEAK